MGSPDGRLAEVAVQEFVQEARMGDMVEKATS
jgi:hypothetical protein